MLQLESFPKWKRTQTTNDESKCLWTTPRKDFAIFIFNFSSKAKAMLTSIQRERFILHHLEKGQKGSSKSRILINISAIIEMFTIIVALNVESFTAARVDLHFASSLSDVWILISATARARWESMEEWIESNFVHKLHQFRPVEFY